MSLWERIKAIVGRRDAIQSSHAEDVPDPSGRPRSDQQGFEEVKDDDSVARGTTPVAPTAGAGTADELREEFESDQQRPADPAP